MEMLIPFTNLGRARVGPTVVSYGCFAVKEVIANIFGWRKGCRVSDYWKSKSSAVVEDGDPLQSKRSLLSYYITKDLF